MIYSKAFFLLLNLLHDLSQPCSIFLSFIALKVYLHKSNRPRLLLPNKNNPNPRLASPPWQGAAGEFSHFVRNILLAAKSFNRNKSCRWHILFIKSFYRVFFKSFKIAFKRSVAF